MILGPYETNLQPDQEYIEISTPPNAEILSYYTVQAEDEFRFGVNTLHEPSADSVTHKFMLLRFRHEIPDGGKVMNNGQWSSFPRTGGMTPRHVIYLGESNAGVNPSE